jgi:hypothetical protein
MPTRLVGRRKKCVATSNFEDMKTTFGLTAGGNNESHNLQPADRGDHLRLNSTGYHVMADSINLNLF